MDTVFDPGTVAERPFRTEDGIAYGPGVTDMKSGLLAGLYALKAIIVERGGLPFERLVFVANPDEEIGSPTSTPHIAAFAAETRRRARPRVRPGERRHRLVAQGHPRPAADGRPAGRPTRAWSRRRAGARSSRRPGSSRTSTRSTAAGRASPSTSGSSPAGRAPTWWPNGARSRSTSGPRAATRSRPPRPRSGGSPWRPRSPTRPSTSSRWPAGGRWRSSSGAAGSSSHAQAVARALGFEVADAATGGASDANTTSGLGVPSLDGLGPIGGNDHAPAEYLDARLDRAPDDAPGRPAARDRGRSGGRRLARRASRARRRGPAAEADAAGS